MLLTEGLDAFRFFLNKSAIDHQIDVNPARGHKYVPVRSSRSTGHIMAITRYTLTNREDPNHDKILAVRPADNIRILSASRRCLFGYELQHLFSTVIVWSGAASI